MSQFDEVRGILSELGLAEYANAFIEEGFDSWQTLCEIKEEDLDFFNVKLGHRRKLQRAISDARGSPRQHPPSLTTERSGSGSGSGSGPRGRDDPDQSRGDQQEGSGRTKRKYKRHPKPDGNAPVRPPSAYVLFASHVRDELKDQDLNFTTMAKTVGIKWQALLSSERQVFEHDANTRKEKYLAELADYRKTDQYAQYRQYLADFKKQQESKRPKRSGDTNGTLLEPESPLRQSPSASGESKSSFKPPALYPSGSSLSMSPRSPFDASPSTAGSLQSNRAANYSDLQTAWSQPASYSAMQGMSRGSIDAYGQASQQHATREALPAVNSLPYPPQSSNERMTQYPEVGRSSLAERSQYPYPRYPTSSTPNYADQASTRLPPILGSTAPAGYAMSDSASTFGSQNRFPQPLSRDTTSVGVQPLNNTDYEARSLQAFQGSEASLPPLNRNDQRGDRLVSENMHDPRDPVPDLRYRAESHSNRPKSPHTGRSIDGELTPPPRLTSAAESTKSSTQGPSLNRMISAPVAHPPRDDLLQEEEMDSFSLKPHVSEMRSSSRKSPRVNATPN